MRPASQTVSSATVGAPIVLDFRADKPTTEIGCTATGTLTYKVQYTTDDVFAVGWSAGTATWFDHATITGKTASFDGSLTIPATAVRLNVTAWTSGSVTMRVICSSGPGA